MEMATRRGRNSWQVPPIIGVDLRVAFRVILLPIFILRIGSIRACIGAIARTGSDLAGRKLSHYTASLERRTEIVSGSAGKWVDYFP